MTKDIQVLTPTGVTYMRKTKHGFTIIGRHTNAMTKSAEKLNAKKDAFNKSTALNKAEQDFNNLMQKAFYEFPSDDFEKLVSYILATLVLNYES